MRQPIEEQRKLAQDGRLLGVSGQELSVFGPKTLSAASLFLCAKVLNNRETTITVQSSAEGREVDRNVVLSQQHQAAEEEKADEG